MEQQKGFSLVEVLISLSLATLLALSLLQQQWQTKQLLNQLILREQGSQYLDQTDEALWAGVKNYPALPAPYHVAIRLDSQSSLLRLIGLGKKDVLQRRYFHIAVRQ